MKSFVTVFALSFVAGASQATLVDFSVTAQVSSVYDSTSHFGTVHLGDTFTVHVSFDTDFATKVSTTGVYPDAAYQIGGAPNYMETHLDSNNLTSDGSYNYLYVTDTHPSVDFIDYQAALAPGEYVEMYFQGPKGTLSSTDIPLGYPNMGWTTSSVRYTWVDPSGSSFSEIDATSPSPTPEPATMGALTIGALGLIRTRRRAKI